MVDAWLGLVEVVRALHVSNDNMDLMTRSSLPHGF
jgi:hypothetical protein